MTKKTFVKVWQESGDQPLGTLFCDVARGKEVYSFEFDPDAIANGFAVRLIDPALFPQMGRQFPLDSSVPFGFMKDALPDRWGRKLIERANPGRTLFESDYLLSVSDETRMGAFRFYLEEGKPLAEGTEVPPIRNLVELEHEAFWFEESLDDARWRLLLDPGSSLGGSRPKANILDRNGDYHLAKFSKSGDEFDYCGIEYLTYLLAKDCGVIMEPSHLERLPNGRAVFLTKRFDREGKARFPVASFMTLLDAQDGDSGSYSYLDLASQLAEVSMKPNKDLEQLFRRAAFGHIIHNTDDHLRNHSVRFVDDGWRLSPAFDININPYGGTHTLRLCEEGETMEDLIHAAPYFRLNEEQARTIVDGMRKTIEERFKKYAVTAGLDTGFTERLYRVIAPNL